MVFVLIIYKSSFLDVRELVELTFTHMELFTHLGSAPPSGILLHGPPGEIVALILQLLESGGFARSFRLRCLLEGRTIVTMVFMNSDGLSHKTHTFSYCVVFLFPGSGKTLLAHAIAGELKVPMIKVVSHAVLGLRQTCSP